MSLYHASRNIIEHYWLPASVSLAILSALLLPLNLLTNQRFHHDEALYATWAVNIASGRDVWLAETALDKPPLFLYTVAAAVKLLGISEATTRLPSLLATATSICLTFWLGRSLYSNSTGMLAAWLMALSPYTILFAPTTFTDPMLVMLILAGCLAAVYGRAGWCGILAGLAVSTKQHGLLFLPLMMALLLLKLKDEESRRYKPALALLWFGIGLTGTLLPALVWDTARNQPSGFYKLSVTNYGGLRLDAAGLVERWDGFVGLLFYVTASPLLNAIFFIGWPLLIGFGFWQAIGHKERSASSVSHSAFYADCLISCFIVLFLLVHTLLSFQIWDRYLLGLVPFLAMILARVLLLPWVLLQIYRPQASTFLPATGLAIMIALLLVLSLARPVQDAVNARYPLGSNSHALGGIEQIVAYLQGHVGANHTLYHRWLGTHWRFYLANYPYDLQYWNNPTKLANKIKAGHLIAFPTSRSDTEARLSLYQAGFTLHEVARAYGADGIPTIILYRAENIDN